jgi:hypothetical protein
MANVKDVQTMARNYANVQKLVGADKIVVPGKSTTPEQWQEIYDKLGRPKAEEYKVEVDKDAQLNPDFVKDFTGKLHAAGVLPHQAKEIMNAIAESNKGYVKSQSEAMAARQAEQMNSLKTEWGSAYNENISRARAFLKEFATPEDLKAMQQNGFGHDPNFIRLASKAGALLSEDQIKGQGGQGKSFTSPADAQAKISEITSNVKHAYFNSADPGHYAAKQEMERLFAAAYPDKPK